MKFISTGLFLLIFVTSCSSQSCTGLKSFKTYREAFLKITNATFNFTDECDFSRSSWLESGQYYSCDGEVGYMIFTTKAGKSYIHEDLPIDVWNEFKEAESFGNFYNLNIKHIYRLVPDDE